jgi:hypothetical protein
LSRRRIARLSFVLLPFPPAGIGAHALPGCHGAGVHDGCRLGCVNAPALAAIACPLIARVVTSLLRSVAQVPRRSLHLGLSSHQKGVCRMAQASLVLHCGAREVSRDELDAVPCPKPAGRWVPVPHGTVLTHALDALTQAGYDVERMQLGLSRGDARFFGLCPAGHNPNCAECRIMQRLSDSTAGTTASLSVAGPDNSASVRNEGGKRRRRRSTRLSIVRRICSPGLPWTR